MSEDIFREPQINEKFELESKIGERIKLLLKALEGDIAKQVQEMVWTACNDYVEYAEWEPLDNWKSRCRTELIEERSYLKDEYWGRTIRRTILAEHKEELLPLLQNDLIATQAEEIERRLNRNTGY
jgi:hypothetical protein